MLDNKFVASYLKDAHSEVRLFGMDGSYLRTVETPGLGTVAGFGGLRTDKETFLLLHQLCNAGDPLPL